MQNERQVVLLGRDQIETGLLAFHLRKEGWAAETQSALGTTQSRTAADATGIVLSDGEVEACPEILEEVRGSFDRVLLVGDSPLTDAQRTHFETLGMAQYAQRPVEVTWLTEWLRASEAKKRPLPMRPSSSDRKTFSPSEAPLPARLQRELPTQEEMKHGDPDLDYARTESRFRKRRQTGFYGVVLALFLLASLLSWKATQQTIAAPHSTTTESGETREGIQVKSPVSVAESQTHISELGQGPETR